MITKAAAKPIPIPFFPATPLCVQIVRMNKTVSKASLNTEMKEIEASAHRFLLSIAPWTFS